MVLNKQKQDPINVKVEGEKIQNVKEFKYLGNLIIQDRRRKKEIKSKKNRQSELFYKKDPYLKLAEI